MQPPELVKVKHSCSDESLFHDIRNVIHAPDEVISRVIGARPRQDREELKRILGHLPTVKSRRSSRSAAVALSQQQSLAVAPSGGPMERAVHAGALVPTPPLSARPSTGPRLVRGGGAPATPQSARGPPSRGGVAPATPQSARRPHSRGGGTPRGLVQRVETPRRASRPSSSRAAQPPGAPLAGGPLEPSATSLRVEQVALPATPVPVAAGPERAATAPNTIAPNAMLAELGIDPRGMTSNDILRTYYARREQTTSRVMNAQAETRLTAVRAQTPRSFDGVFTKQAHDEMRVARHACPVTEMHLALDKWEVDVLAEVCRSVRYFDEEGKGGTTEYMRQFERRAYGHRPDRKRVVKQPV